METKVIFDKQFARYTKNNADAWIMKSINVARHLQEEKAFALAVCNIVRATYANGHLAVFLAIISGDRVFLRRFAHALANVDADIARYVVHYSKTIFQSLMIALSDEAKYKLIKIYLKALAFDMAISVVNCMSPSITKVTLLHAISQAIMEVAYAPSQHLHVAWIVEAMRLNEEGRDMADTLTSNRPQPKPRIPTAVKKQRPSSNRMNQIIVKALSELFKCEQYQGKC